MSNVIQKYFQVYIHLDFTSDILGYFEGYKTSLKIYNNIQII